MTADVQIDLKLPEKGLALAEHGSFSRAADALQISQPGLSRSIKELEGRIGLQLFNRDRSGIEPTDFGRLFLQQAADVLARAGDLQREVALAKGLQSGELTIGFGPYAAAALAAECASRFAAAHPQIRLRIIAKAPAELGRLLRARTIDLCVAESSVVDPADDLDVIATLAPIRAYIALRKGHPLEDRNASTLADVFEYPYVQVVMLPPRMLQPLLAARRKAAKAVGKPTPPFPAIECPTFEMAMSIVARTDAFTFATLGMLREPFRTGHLVQLLSEQFMHTSWSILRLRNRTTSPAAVSLIGILERVHAGIASEESELSGRLRSKRAVKTKHGLGKRHRPNFRLNRPGKSGGSGG